MSTEFVMNHKAPEMVVWKFIYLSGFKEWIEYDPEIDNSTEFGEWWLPHSFSPAHKRYYFQNYKYGY